MSHGDYTPPISAETLEKARKEAYPEREEPCPCDNCEHGAWNDYGFCLHDHCCSEYHDWYDGGAHDDLPSEEDFNAFFEWNNHR